MRSILLAVALAATTLVTSVRVADACGGSYEWKPTAPAVHTVVTPAISEAKMQRFALLTDRRDAKRARMMKWTQLDRMSFDTTKTSPGRRLSDPTRLTLLGPSGTKLVSLASTVWVDRPFDHTDAREAVALPKGDFVVALDGHFKDATWTGFDVVYGDTVTSFNAEYFQVVLQAGSRTFALNGRSIEGYPLGLVSVNNVRYLAVRSTDGNNTTWLEQI